MNHRFLEGCPRNPNHIASRVKGGGLYMKDLNSTPLRSFIDGIDLIAKKN